MMIPSNHQTTDNSIRLLVVYSIGSAHPGFAPREIHFGSVPPCLITRQPLFVLSV